MRSWPCAGLHQPGFGQWRILGQVGLDPIEQGLGHLLLVVLIPQAFLLLGLLMKAVSTRMDGVSGAFKTAKPACSTCCLCRLFTRFI